MEREPPQLIALLPAPQEAAVSKDERPHPSTTTFETALQQSPQQRQPERYPGDHRMDMRQSQFDPLQSQHGSSSQLPDNWAPDARMTQHIQLATQASQWGGSDQVFATQASQMDPPPRLGNPASATAGPSGGGQQKQQHPSKAPGLRGMVAAGNLGAGDVISCAFSIRQQQLCLHAQPPDAQEGVHSTHAEAPFGRILAHASSVALLSGSRQDGKPGSSSGAGAMPELGPAVGHVGGFSWAPRSSVIAQSLGLPRRISWPMHLHARWALHLPTCTLLTDEFVCIVPCRSKNFLQETMLQKRPVQRVFDVTVRESVMRRPEDALAGMSSPEAARELEAILKDAPDLQGIAFVANAPDLQGIAFVANAPDKPRAPEGQPSHALPSRDTALMLRLDFLGHLHLQCMRLPWAVHTPAVVTQVTHACLSIYFACCTLC